MLKSKLLIGAIGLAILLAPQQLSSSTTVSEFMKDDIQTRTKEISKEVKLQKEFVSTHAEFIPEEKHEKEVIEDDSKEYIGKFTITHYCVCDTCNYPYGGYPAANGEDMVVGYTIAVDPKVIPLDTMIEIDGYDGIREAQDTGGRIKGNKIDVLVSSHKEAYKLGVKRDVDVWISKE